MLISKLKVPQNRLTWPALLEHPFVKETTKELEAREMWSATAAERGCVAAWCAEGNKILTPGGLVISSGGKSTSPASSDDNSGISFQDVQSNIPDSQAVSSTPNEETQSGSQILDGLENNSLTVKGALMIGQDNGALAHVLLPLKRCSQGSQNSSRDQDILTSNQSLRILSNLVAAGAITFSGLLDEIIHNILVYTTFIVSIKSSELNELRAKSFSTIKVLVDDVEHCIVGSYFRHWVALSDSFSQVVSCSEEASGRVMFESIACVTFMLTRVNQGLRAFFSTPALQEVSGPYETVKQILDHAKTFGLVDKLCLGLSPSGASLIAGSSKMLRSACEACRANWLLVDALDFLSTKGIAVSFPLNSMRSLASDHDRGGYVIWTESAKLVAVVTRALIRSKPVQVAIHYCLHQRLEASVYAGTQLLLRCCLQSGIVPGILCSLPGSLPVTTVVSGGGDMTIISEIFSLLSLCISSQNNDPQAIETTNLKSKITDPNTLVLHSCLILASVAQFLKATGRNSALFMLTTSSKNQLSRLSVLAHQFSSGESTNSSSQDDSQKPTGPVAFLAKMIGQRPLAVQFVGKGLLDPTKMRRLLDRSCPKEVVLDVLMMVSDLARMDKIENAPYHDVVLYEKLRRSIPQPANLLPSSSEKGTTIGIFSYDGGKMGFTDTRLTCRDDSNVRVSSRDDSFKHVIISSWSNLFFLKCGNVAQNILLANVMIRFVRRREQETGQLVSADRLAAFAEDYLTKYLRHFPQNGYAMGGIFIGWLPDKSYEARLVFLARDHLMFDRINDYTDLEGLNPVKRAVALGSGEVYVKEIMCWLNHHPGLDLDGVKNVIGKIMLSTALSMPDTGGSTVFYDFPDKKRGYLHEAIDPCDLHLEHNSCLYSDQILLLRVKVVDTGPVDFEDDLASRRPHNCVSLFVVKKGYRYYRVMCIDADEAESFYNELMSFADEEVGESLFKSTVYPWGGNYISLDVARCSEDLLREIAHLDYLP